MASIAKISKAYRGKLAENYDTVRDKQRRWHRENDIVAEMLETLKGPVMDCPVGTGRFLKLYKRLGLTVTGIDSSEAMVSIARTKDRKASVSVGSITSLGGKNKAYKTFVCVRFLNLIEDLVLPTVMNEITRVTSHNVILTIRLGPAYHSNSSMATHDEKKFRALIKRLGWQVVRDETEQFQKGWHLMLLVRQ